MSKKFCINFSLAAALGLAIHLPSYAGVYKWVDDNGQVHYGEQPGNNSAQQMTIRDNTTTTPRQPKKTHDEKAAGKNTGQEQQEVSRPAAGETPEISRKEKSRLCEEAKNDYASISSRGRMREVNSKGEYTYLSEQQRQQRLSAAKNKQREYCR